MTNRWAAYAVDREIIFQAVWRRSHQATQGSAQLKTYGLFYFWYFPLNILDDGWLWAIESVIVGTMGGETVTSIPWHKYPVLFRNFVHPIEKQHFPLNFVFGNND